MHDGVPYTFLGRVRQNAIGVNHHNEFDRADNEQHHKHHTQGEFDSGLALSLSVVHSPFHFVRSQFITRIETWR